MKPVDVNSNIFVDFDVKNKGKILNLKWKIMKDIKIRKYLTFQISLKKFLRFKKIKRLCREHMLLRMLT